ncbi:MAG TPA: SRPBCC family protein [Fimbriimonas sp.]
MSEYRSVITVNADADDVFGFLSDPENTPRYLPTHRICEDSNDPQPGTSAQTEILRIDEDSRRLEWAARSGTRCQGWLQVTGDTRSCQLIVRVLFPHGARSGDSKKEDAESVNANLRQALRTIKEVCEGTQVPGGGVAYPG